MPGGSEVRHRLHHAVVGVEGGLGQVLSVTGGGDGGHVQGRMLVVKLLQHLPDQGHRIAQVRPVVGKRIRASWSMTTIFTVVEPESTPMWTGAA